MCYRKFGAVPLVVYSHFSGDVTSTQECLRALPASLCVSVARRRLYALCELRKYGLTSLQHLCHPLYKSLLSDLCQGDKWHENLEWAITWFFFFFLLCVWTRQMKSKVRFTGGKWNVCSNSHVCLLGDLLSVSESDCSFFWKPSGAQEVGRMDMQQLGKCITLCPSNVFIQIHLNIIAAFSQHENSAACQLIPITT